MHHVNPNFNIQPNDNSVVCQILPNNCVEGLSTVLPHPPAGPESVCGPRPFETVCLLRAAAKHRITVRAVNNICEAQTVTVINGLYWPQCRNVIGMFDGKELTQRQHECRRRRCEMLVNLQF